MLDSQKIVLASNNKGKLAEFQVLFDETNLGLTIVPQGELGIDDAIEDGLSFVENALIKARHASSKSGLPAIADDSGLCVPILGNFPGIYSARFAGEHGNDLANNNKLLCELAPFFEKGETVEAFFVCVLALVRHQDDPLPIIAQGLWRGQILPQPQGEHGFGYDPLFWLPELQKTSAQLDKAKKNKISHRGQALQSLISMLKS
ncbi:RdgB/HAM1 family non-canonical purine NTP pyrophosphatase [Moraxella sp. ZY200743]|uniref:RdgB/HAM1 family non-canonical purine NTP pyrophosphatase n=1 Tax=Moraxella sp. ZY200743 TaxID=2911970 RepID=UPI003D7C5901